MTQPCATLGRIAIASRTLVCVMLLAARALPAQNVRDTDGDRERANAPEPSWKLAHCVSGMTYGAPLKFALAYGGGLKHESDGRDLCVLSAAKIGSGGALVAAGFATSVGSIGGGASLTANVLRTFAHPLSAHPRTTYAGASLHLWPLLAIGGEIGIYTRLGSMPSGATLPTRLVAWSVGFGF